MSINIISMYARAFCQRSDAIFIVLKNERILNNRVFRKLIKLAIMAMLASEVLLREKNPVAKCYPQWE